MDNKDFIIETITKQNADLTALVQTLTESNAALTETIKELQETIKELQRQLNQNSQNSSKPPSSDGFNKPNPQSQHQKSGKKQGGQKGHKGTHMSIPHEPDEYHKHLPHKCLSCSHLNECITNGKIFTCGEKRYEVNAVITTKVTEHQSIRVESCPCTGETLSGEFPEGIRAYVQYGDSVSVLAGLLSTYGAVSTMRIHVLLGSLLGVSLSTGTITSMVSKCAKKVGSTLETIKAMLIGAKVANFDETGTDVNGKTIWVHNSSTPELTYQTINARRGQAGMEGNGVLTEFGGIAVHDCWSPYWKYSNITHAVCNAHLLRELTGVEQYSPEHTWAPEFKTLLRSMKKARDKAAAKGKMELSYYYLHKFDLVQRKINKQLFFCIRAILITAHQEVSLMAHAYKIDLIIEDRDCLQFLTRQRTIQAQVVDCAKTLLYKAEGISNGDIADRLDVSINTVKLCLKKYKEGSIQRALFDDRRTGRRVEITDDAVAWIIDIACQWPADLGYAQELWTFKNLHKHIQEHA